MSFETGKHSSLFYISIIHYTNVITFLRLQPINFM